MATTRAATATAEQGEMNAQLERIDQEVRAFVKDRPILALLGAVAAGYVIGRMMRRFA